VNLAAAVAARWAADDELAALLAEYEGGPAIVVADEDTAPEGVPSPCVVIVGVVSDEDDGDKSTDGRDRTVTAFVFTDATGSTKRVNEIAERCRALVHRQPEGLAPGAWMASASIAVVKDDPSVYSRQVDVRVRSES
jgi:hypothetical protein